MPPPGSRRSATFRRCASEVWRRCVPRSNPLRYPTTCPTWPAITDAAIPGPGGALDVRIYRPTDDSAQPVLVYFHGGGLVMGSNHSFEPLARVLASASARHRGRRGLPAGAGGPRRLRNSTTPIAAVWWVSRNADDLGVDAARLAVVGDSAGGSLAAAVALAARDRGGPAICAQVLLYPGLDRDMTAPSITAHVRRTDARPRRHRVHARAR